MSDTDTKTTAVAVIENPLAGIGNLPATADYSADGGQGFENTTKGDFKLPWLKVLDAKSKQVETVADAKAGLIINTVTNALFKDILFVPAVTEAYFVEWKPRAQGGGGGQGFVGVHLPTDPMVIEAQKALGTKFQKGTDGKIILPKSPAGNDLVETYYVHGVQVNEGTGDLIPAIIAFSSTGIPVYQSWMTTARLETFLDTGSGKRKPKPLFAHAYRLGATKIEKNGNSWYVFSTAFAFGSAAKSALNPASDIYAAARSVHASVMSGDAASKIDHAGAAAAEGTKSAADDEIPF